MCGMKHDDVRWVPRNSAQVGAQGKHTTYAGCQPNQPLHAFTIHQEAQHLQLRN